MLFVVLLPSLSVVLVSKFIQSSSKPAFQASRKVKGLTDEAEKEAEVDGEAKREMEMLLTLTRSGGEKDKVKSGTGSAEDSQATTTKKVPKMFKLIEVIFKVIFSFFTCQT